MEKSWLRIAPGPSPEASSEKTPGVADCTGTTIVFEAAPRRDANGASARREVIRQHVIRNRPVAALGAGRDLQPAHIAGCGPAAARAGVYNYAAVACSGIHRDAVGGKRHVGGRAVLP